MPDALILLLGITFLFGIRAVAEIISIDQKLKLVQKKKADITRKRKLAVVQKVFQCTHCAFKCERCGTQIGTFKEENRDREQKLRVPYRFCESCSDEYIDYIEQCKGGGNSEYYWHDEKWFETWSKWIDYQGAMDSYLKSKKFTQLLRELKQTTPDQ